MSKYFISQKVRMIISIVNVILLLIANYIISGTFFPQINNKALWFICCLLNILLANQLLTPYFTKPVDSISFSVTCLVSIVTMKPETTWITLSFVVYYFIIVYTLSIIIISIACIILRDSKNEHLRYFSEQIKTTTSFLGTAKILFSLLFFFSLVTYHFQNSKEILVISIAYLFFVIQSPIDYLFTLFNKIFMGKKLKNNVISSGEIIAYQEPNVILVRQETEADIPYMTGIIFKDQYSIPKLGYSLNYIGKSDGILLRTYIFERTNNEQILNDIKGILLNSALFVTNDYLIKNNIIVRDKKTIGLVTVDSSVEFISFEIILDEDIEVGTLICTNIRRKEIIYQVINGLTKEEIIQKKNTYGFINVIARKIGEWDVSKNKFITNNWLPNINSEVTRCEKNNIPLLSTPIGLFPGSNYPIYIDDIHSLVTHNTAVLGVLGIGKSMLSIELVERLISQNIKVIVLDLTNQYRLELKDFIDVDYEQKCLKKILDAGENDRDNQDENPSKGGSKINFIEALRQDIYDLLNNDKNRNLKIYNPGQLFATKQNYEPKSYRIEDEWHRTAQLFTLTPVEITQIVSEVALELVSNEMRDTARLCLVLEEAHSLIPEFSSIVVENDKHATNGTARAILQGRKYGFGCIVVTQRTANVTKTILNQCNSIFAMRTFDETGKDFLANYIGKDYTNLLSSLSERQAVYFGKSSSCENPVLIRLNDRQNFISEYRKQYPLKEIIKDVPKKRRKQR